MALLDPVRDRNRVAGVVFFRPDGGLVVVELGADAGARVVPVVRVSRMGRPRPGGRRRRFNPRAVPETEEGLLNAMSITPGYLVAFRSSVRVCLQELQALSESGKVLPSDLSASLAELSCMASVLDMAQANSF